MLVQMVQVCFSWLPIFICFAIVYAQKLPEIRAALFGEA